MTLFVAGLATSLEHWSSVGSRDHICLICYQVAYDIIGVIGFKEASNMPSKELKGILLGASNLFK